jgi:hypothetical protein
LRERGRLEDEYEWIKTDRKGIGWEGMGWINLAQDKNKWLTLVSTVIILRVPYVAVNFLTS